MIYCAGKLIEKLKVYWRDNPCGMFQLGEHEKSL